MPGLKPKETTKRPRPPLAPTLAPTPTHAACTDDDELHGKRQRRHDASAADASASDTYADASAADASASDAYADASAADASASDINALEATERPFPFTRPSSLCRTMLDDTLEGPFFY